MIRATADIGSISAAFLYMQLKIKIGLLNGIVTVIIFCENESISEKAIKDIPVLRDDFTLNTISPLFRTKTA